MPERRGMRGALSGLGEAIASGSQNLAATVLQSQGEKRRAALGMLKDLEDKVSGGTLEPEQAQTIADARGLKVDPGYFLAIQSPVRSQLAKVVDPINKATSLDALPTTEGLNATMPPRIGPITQSNIPERFRDPSQTEAGLDQLTPGAGQVADALQAKRRALVANIVPTKGDTAYDPASGAMTREPDSRWNPLMQARETFGGPTQLTPTPEESGYNKAVEEATTLRTGAMQGVPTLKAQGAAQQATITKQLENVLGLPQATADAQNTQSTLTRGTRAADAAAITTATAGAQMPFQQAMAKFANELAQGNKTLATVNDPATGLETPALISKTGEPPILIQMPDGMEFGKARQLPATIADNVAGMNAAEIEAVKILRALKTTGLDQSNDPVEPRFNKFLINVLRVAPNDPMMADIQQRTGFVNATLTRNLMGSRPSQYVAKEIIQPHLPQQAMSGKLLYDTLNRVLQQAGERREQFAQTYGLPLARMSPRNEPNSYANFLKESGTPSTQPPQLEVDPVTGTLRPATPQRK